MLAGEANAAALQSFLDAILAYEQQQQQQQQGSIQAPASAGTQCSPPPPISLDAATADKAQRTAVHAFFRKPGLPRLQTDSVTAGGKSARGGADCGSGVHAIRVTYLPQVMPLACSTCSTWTGDHCKALVPVSCVICACCLWPG